MACCECISGFFFKQKTAYEMRISDCSSDVCSSDLPDQLIDDVLQRCHGQAQRHQVALHVVQPAHRGALERLAEDVVFQLLHFLAEVAHDRQQVVDDEVEYTVDRKSTRLNSSH